MEGDKESQMLRVYTRFLIVTISVVLPMIVIIDNAHFVGMTWFETWSVNEYCESMGLLLPYS